MEVKSGVGRLTICCINQECPILLLEGQRPGGLKSLINWFGSVQFRLELNSTG